MATKKKPRGRPPAIVWPEPIDASPGGYCTGCPASVSQEEVAIYDGGQGAARTAD